MPRPVLLALLALLALPAAARAETVTESYRVPTVDGAQVYVEVTRDPAVKTPVILTYSPYNVLGEGQETQDAYGTRSVPRGYARAVTDVIGTSSESWEAAARSAVNTASKSLRDLRIAEVTKLDVKIDNGKVTQFRTRLSLSFKFGG